MTYLEWASSAFIVMQVLGILVTLVFSRRTTFAVGFYLGKMLSRFFVGKYGAAELSFENKFQATLTDFIEGVQAGLDHDDAQPEKIINKYQKKISK